jgi:hypothetical protein
MQTVTIGREIAALSADSTRIRTMPATAECIQLEVTRGRVQPNEHRQRAVIFVRRQDAARLAQAILDAAAW